MVLGNVILILGSDKVNSGAASDWLTVQSLFIVILDVPLLVALACQCQ